MNNVDIYEQQLLDEKEQAVGKMAVLRVAPQIQDPESIMTKAVTKYVGNNPYNEFVEIYLDNPWIRVIIGGINKLDFEPFSNQNI